MVRFRHSFALCTLMAGAALAQARFTAPEEPASTYQVLGKLPEAWVLRTQPAKPAPGETLLQTYRLVSMDSSTIRVQCVSYAFTDDTPTELGRLAYSVTIREGTPVFARSRSRLMNTEDPMIFLRALKALCTVKDPLGIRSKVPLTSELLPLHEVPAYNVRVDKVGDMIRAEALQR